MGRIAVLEPAAEVRELFVLVIARGGHEPVLVSDAVPADADAVVVEPASEPHLTLALEARRARPELPIVCVSILPRDATLPELAPHAYLVKPFPAAELIRALHSALGPSEPPT